MRVRTLAGPLALLLVGGGALAAGLTLRAGDARARGLAASALAMFVREHVDGHARALDAASARLASLEALPPEVLSRTLAATAAANPDFERLYACDATGKVIAFWASHPDPTTPGEESSPPRRAAMKAGPWPWRYVGIGGPAGSERVELASGVSAAAPSADAAAAAGQGPPSLYLAADLSLAPLGRTLAAATAAHDVPIGLSAADGRVLLPANAGLPTGAYTADAGHGLTVHAGFSSPRAAWLLIVAGVLALCAAVGAVAAAFAARAVIKSRTA